LKKKEKIINGREFNFRKDSGVFEKRNSKEFDFRKDSLPFIFFYFFQKKNKNNSNFFL
jgi:hypothetical protein